MHTAAINTFPQPLPIDKKNEALKMVTEQGYTIRECAEKLRISPNTVAAWSTRGGWAALAQINSNRTKNSEIVRTQLGRSIMDNAGLLASNKPKKVEELGNTPTGEGRASILLKTVNAASLLFGWDKTGENGPLAGTVRFADEVVDVEEVKQISDAPDANTT